MHLIYLQDLCHLWMIYHALDRILAMVKDKSITIHDIARAAGVSPSTVSRVLNSTTPVAEDKRAAVLAAIDELNYRPNAAAQGLASGRSMTIGVVTQSVGSPFYTAILRGIEQGLQTSGYQLLFASGNWRMHEERKAVEALTGRRVDALIVMGGRLPDEQLRQVAAQVPLVVIGQNVAGLEAHCLRVDNVRGAYQATRHLLDLGHRRIAHITGDLSHADAIERRDGYAQALADAGIAVDPQLIVEGTFVEQSGLLALEALISRAMPFTALFAANDQMAYGARLALYRRGIRVPEDLSLIGFDDLFGSAYTTPPLTTVRQPMDEVGRAAARAALQLLAGQPLAPQIFPAELVVRESTALCR
ncbi:MAG TPA: substrate-binding domain-containing protein [Roseiflexaceae bacterium]|nr:substrate-binding domain-containing protein [Roseiflexaceae bacterium]